eukprot:26434-Rhodomonas_salina.1
MVVDARGWFTRVTYPCLLATGQSATWGEERGPSCAGRQESVWFRGAGVGACARPCGPHKGRWRHRWPRGH